LDTFTPTPPIGLTVPPIVAELDQSILVVASVFEPSKVCAVAELDESKDLAAVFAASNSCEIVELRFRK
jgi:hypothetical protein